MNILHCLRLMKTIWKFKINNRLLKLLHQLVEYSSKMSQLRILLNRKGKDLTQQHKTNLKRENFIDYNLIKTAISMMSKWEQLK